ncbi:MAG TPA: MgtC/SapB family protein [Paracoccaceae bacterium]
MTDLILRFGIALSIGLLVGLERGWRERDEPSGSRTAGIRTYGIVGLLGGVLASLAVTFGAAHVFSAGFLGFGLLFGWFQAREVEFQGTFSVTAVIAGLCVFALGGLAVAGDFRVAAAGGAALAATLASRDVLHGLLKRLSWIELRSALVLAVMTTIILPLLPNRTIDPWGGFNPWEVWFLTVLIAAISYLGYVAVKVLGPTRGLIVSAIAGAVVSSTAVTLAFGRNARTGGNARALAGAAALAAMVSVLRVSGIVLLIQPVVLPQMGPAALIAAVVFGGGGLLMLMRHAQMPSDGGRARNPFELLPLLAFAAVFGTVATISAASVERFGTGSLAVSSALSGTFDVDVSVLSALRLLGQAVPPPAVGQAVLAGLAANAVGRLFVAIAAGPPAYWLPLTLLTLLALAAGLGVFVLLAPL